MDAQEIEGRRLVIARAQAMAELQQLPAWRTLREYLERKADELSREVIRREPAATPEQLAEVRGAIRALEQVAPDIEQMIADGEELREDDAAAKVGGDRLRVGGGELAL